jgi:hypothetical protein
MFLEVFLNSRELVTESFAEDILAHHESVVEMVVGRFHVGAAPTILTATAYPDAGITLRVKLAFIRDAERMTARTVGFKNGLSYRFHLGLLTSLNHSE